MVECTWVRSLIENIGPYKGKVTRLADSWLALVAQPTNQHGHLITFNAFVSMVSFFGNSVSTICSAWRKSFQPAHIEYFQLNFTFLQTSSFKLCTYKFRRETQDNHAPFQSYQKKILYRNISYDNNHTKRPIIAIAQDSIRYSTHFWRNGRIFRHDLGTALIVNARGRHETSRDKLLLFRISLFYRILSLP